MRALAMLVLPFVLLTSTNALAQDALTIATPPGKSLVWDPEFTVPDHNPETEVVAFRLHPFEADTADMPYFIDRVGTVIPKVTVDTEVLALLEGTRFAVLLCAFTQPGSFNVALPEVRAQYCTLRRAERQP